MKEKSIISIELPQELRQALRVFAFEHELSMSAALRYIIADYLNVASEDQSSDTKVSKSN